VHWGKFIVLTTVTLTTDAYSPIYVDSAASKGSTKLRRKNTRLSELVARAGVGPASRLYQNRVLTVERTGYAVTALTVCYSD
jgi:hypothetical protein